MTRIEIVTQLMAACIIRSGYGAHFMGECDIEDCERLADVIIDYDGIYQSGKVK